MRTRIPVAVAATLILAGCTAAPADPGTEPDAPAEPTVACEVGSWVLDVADFEAQSVEFLTAQGIPITDFVMTGDGSLDIGDDGYLAGVVSLTSAGTLVPSGAPPTDISVPSSYTFSGQWAVGDDPDTIDLSDWAQVADVGAPTPDVVAPFLDFTDVPTVSSACDDTSLRLQGPDAPLSALWHRA
jgi:hypothetical protein